MPRAKKRVQPRNRVKPSHVGISELRDPPKKQARHYGIPKSTAMTRSMQRQADDNARYLIARAKTGFFDLPIELRMNIYELVLLTPTPIHVDLLEGGRRTDSTWRPETRDLTTLSQRDVTLELSPAILQTCKAIHYEAGTMLLQQNTFVISIWDHHYFNASGMTIPKFQMLRHLVLWFPRTSVDPNKMVRQFKFISKINNLQSCIIEITRGRKKNLAVLLDFLYKNLVGIQIRIKHITKVTGDAGPKIGHPRPPNCSRQDVEGMTVNSIKKLCDCWDLSAQLWKRN